MTPHLRPISDHFIPNRSSLPRLLKPTAEWSCLSNPVEAEVVCLPQISHSNTWAVTPLRTTALIRKIQTWITQASASFGGCSGMRSFISRQSISRRSAIYHLHTPLQLQMPHPDPPVIQIPAAHPCLHLACLLSEQLQRYISTSISQQQLCCVGHAAVSWELVRPITLQWTVIERATSSKTS